MIPISDQMQIDYMPEMGVSDIEHINDILDRNEKVKIINDQLRHESINVRNVIGLKAKGYDNYEISDRLHLDVRTVANYFTKFVSRFRLLHPKLINE
jgi:hypothetical protein